MEPNAAAEPGLFAQIKSFNAVYWIANWMEMFERLAYYGLRTVLPLYLVLSVEAGGPEFTHEQKGAIFAAWALVQSGLPVFTGGYADRYGYKFTVAFAIAVKAIGYIIMAFAVDLAAMATGGASTGVPGHPAVYWIFMSGALGLAGGTAIFKPGLQGIIGLQLSEKTSAVGWSVFYQIVNVGGFLGPFLAGWMRLMDWKYVFISCALIVMLNYVFLFAFPEPSDRDASSRTGFQWKGIPAVLVGLFLAIGGLSGQLVVFGYSAPRACMVLGAILLAGGMYFSVDQGGVPATWRSDREEEGSDDPVWLVLWKSAIGICEPRLMAFLVVFSGFWAMFNQLFDLLPNYIDDWVDSSGVASTIAAPIFRLFGADLPEQWGGNLPQEYMLNLNAGMCMTFAFAVGYLTGKVRSMTAMIGGILLASGAIWALGWSTNGWAILLAIMAFSFGELMSSPTKMRYFSNIAPPGKKGLYLGYINATNGIGWFLGSLIAGSLYEEHGDKVVLARRYLVDVLEQNAATIKELPKDEVVPHLATAMNATPDAMRTLLMETYDPSFIWTKFAILGLVSMAGLIAFDLVTRAKLGVEAWLLIALTGVVSLYTYGWKPAAVFMALMLVYVAVERFAPHVLPSGGKVEGT